MSVLGLRERRSTETAARTIALARAWTAERGLAGFTVNELCAEVEISRSTFFNYFAAKEDAVLGVPSRVDQRGEGEFLDGAGPKGVTGFSSSLLADLGELLVGRHERLGLGPHDLESLIGAIEREPRLIARVLLLTREQESIDIELVERRENLTPGDLRAVLLVQLLGTVLRGAIDETLRGGGREPLRTVFARRLAAARIAFAA